MKITSLLMQKKNDSRYNVYIDDNYCFSADYDDIVEFGLKVGSVFNQAELDELIFKLQYKKAMDRAFYMIDIKARTEYEIRKKLRESEYNDDVIEKVISRLKELNYLDDMQYSKLWVDNRMNLRPVGKRKLISELKTKGVEPYIIEQTIDNCKYDDLDTAIKLLKKKLCKTSLESDYDKQKVYNRLYRFLLYRGIDYDTARKALKLCLNELNDELED